jgi:hypothetical protein
VIGQDEQEAKVLEGLRTTDDAQLTWNQVGSAILDIGLAEGVEICYILILY